MAKTVNIVMYHYVRDVHRTRFPTIRARTLDEFRFQLDHLSATSTFITVSDLIAAVKHGGDLPDDAAMLSFDDGLLDHYTNVLPLLDERGIQGMFFPPGEPIQEHKVMDTHKIHFILSCQPDADRLADQIFSWVDENRERYDLPTTQDIRELNSGVGQFDPAEIVFVKRTLQRGLPKEARNALTGHLFNQYVTEDESAFSAELYMSPAQLQMLSRSGQYVGSHGYTHEWFDVLGHDGVVREIKESLRFLRANGCLDEDWIMCYPHGCYPFNAVTDELRASLRNEGCVLALTDRGGVADLSRDDLFMLPRTDTNYVPFG